MPMSAESCRAELTLPKDPRMIGAVAAVIHHAGERAGLTENEQNGLAQAAIHASEQALELAAAKAGEEKKIHVTVEYFKGRVEVTLEHHGAAEPAAGLDGFVAGLSEGAREIGDALQNTDVDRVQYETKEGVSRTRLIKYAAGRAPSNKSGS
jgi:anti-sigma regulatory factor (Ser/Thr protein kinase)